MEQKKKRHHWIKSFAMYVLLVVTLTVTCISTAACGVIMQLNLFSAERVETIILETDEQKVAKELMYTYLQNGIRRAIESCDGRGIYFSIYKVSSGRRVGGNLAVSDEYKASEYTLSGVDAYVDWLKQSGFEDYKIKIYMNKDLNLARQEELYKQYIWILAKYAYWFLGAMILGAVVSILLSVEMIRGTVKRATEGDNGIFWPIDLVVALMGFGGNLLSGFFGKWIASVGYSSFFFWFDRYIVVLVCGIVFVYAMRCLTKKGWYKHTVIYGLWRVIVFGAKLVKEMYLHLSMLIKAAICLLILSALEVCFFVVCMDGLSSRRKMIFWTVWILWKCVTIPAILYVVMLFKKLHMGVTKLAAGHLDYHVEAEYMPEAFHSFAEDMNAVSGCISVAVDEKLKSERLKTELITNVSHDIKTPLTSIINFADLISKEPTENENITEYAKHLHAQSVRLKKLIEDLMEAAKASTGNLEVNPKMCDVRVLLGQCLGEYEERLQTQNMELIIRQPEENTCILADPRHLWRVFDNLMNNICKYGQEGTRVYLTTEQKDGQVIISFKNISRYPLDTTAEELTERFVRGDLSRHTEGNGLGLSIVKSLMDLQGGKLELVADGDLFKAVLYFEEYNDVY